MLITVKLSPTADTQTINAFLKCFHSYGCGRSHTKQTPPPDNRYITNKKCSMVKKKSFFLNPLFPGAFYDITPFFCFFLALMLVRLMQDSNFYIFTPTETRETQRMLKPVVTRLHWVVSCVGPQQKWRSSYFLFPLTETGYLRTVDKRNGSYFRVRTTKAPPPVGGSCVRPNGPSWLPVWFCCFLVPRTLH